MSFSLPKSRLSSDFVLLIWGGLFLVSRVPFIFSGSGYGLDPDAYYVLLSAQKILATGRYFMSRPPGYPLFEIICALLSPGGPVATTGMTALISLLSLFPFMGIMKLLSVKNQGWLLFTFCFAPILWITSTCTMDYQWALFFVMMAYYFFLDRKYLRGAFFLGIAVGFRITSGLMILPLSLQFLFQEKSIRKFIIPFFLFGLVSLLTYTPVFLSYGFSFWQYVPNNAPFYIWGYRTLSELLGFPALLFLILGIFAAIHNRAKGKSDPNALVLLLVIVSYTFLFLKLPAETAYLLPIIPFGLIFLDKILSRRFLILFCLFFVLNGIISIAVIDKRAYRRNGQIRLLACDYGTVIKNEIRKRRVYQNAQKLPILAEALPGGDNIAVVIGWYQPVFQFFNQNTLDEVNIDGRIPALKSRGRDLFYLESVTREDIRFLKARQFRLYYLDAAQGAMSMTGVDLSKYGQQIPGIDSYPVNY
ncbi:MAG: hypothetical protein AB1611_19725 [bacterium]